MRGAVGTSKAYQAVVVDVKGRHILLFGREPDLRLPRTVDVMVPLRQPRTRRRAARASNRSMVQASRNSRLAGVHLTGSARELRGAGASNVAGCKDYPCGDMHEATENQR